MQVSCTEHTEDGGKNRKGERLRLHLLHRQPHKRAESMFYSLESSFEFLMRRAKAAVIQTQRG